MAESRKAQLRLVESDPFIIIFIQFKTLKFIIFIHLFFINFKVITLSSLSTEEHAVLNLSSGTPHTSNMPSRIFLWFTCYKKSDETLMTSRPMPSEVSPAARKIHISSLLEMELNSLTLALCLIG